MKKITSDYQTSVFGFSVRFKDVLVEIDEDHEKQPVDGIEPLARELMKWLLTHSIFYSGDQIKFMRKHLGLRQMDLDINLGIDQENMSRAENKGNQRGFDAYPYNESIRSYFLKIFNEQSATRKRLKPQFLPRHQAHDIEKTIEISLKDIAA